MFARSFLAGSFVVLAAVVGLTGCEDLLDAPLPAGTNTQNVVKQTCRDDLGSSWSVSPAESTVTPGERLHFVVARNGAKYTSGPGAALIEYSAPQGGTLADETGIETDYAAGSAVGDYTVQVSVTDPSTAKQTCSLTAIVHVQASESQDGGTKPIPATATHVDLSGTWSFSHDANSADAPAPLLSVDGVSSSSVTVGYKGTDGMSCGCNAEHKVIPLGKSFDCSTTTLAFDYAGGGSYGYTSNQAISIRFCKDGTCSQESFYGGDQVKVSQQTGHSNCGWEWNNTLPAPQLSSGHNVIDLGKLSKETNGTCSGTFDTIDIHVEAYACYQDRDHGSQTLSNVVLY